MMTKNDLIDLTIERLGINGEGIATAADGLKVFVPGALEGEKLKVKILAVKKNFAYGKLTEVISRSESRTSAFCPVYEKCGGCSLQHLSYSEQLQFKKQLVKDTLKKVGGIDSTVADCVSDGNHVAYRNKIQVPVGRNNGKNVIGFYRENSHDIIEIAACPLHGDWAANVIDAVKKYMEAAAVEGYDEIKKTGCVRHIVARNLDGKTVVCIVTATKKELPQTGILKELLAQKLTDFSLLQNTNTAETNVVLGPETRPLFGKDELPFEMLSVRGSLSTDSFFQVNFAVAKKLFSAASDYLLPNKKTVFIDAYSGIGVLTALMAPRAADCYGIEIVPAAVSDADRLAKLNGFDNVKNICGDCAEILPKLVSRLRQERREDIAVLLDPPRKGCDSRVLQAVLQAAPSQIIYISCNPATLARDMKILTGGIGDGGDKQTARPLSFDTVAQGSVGNGNKDVAAAADRARPMTIGKPDKESSAEYQNYPASVDESNYRIDSVTPFDMFPHTAHVETLVCLTRKN